MTDKDIIWYGFAMEIKLAPVLITASCLSIYWGTVIIKIVWHIGKTGRDPNVLPRETIGIMVRLILIPVIILWVSQPWLAVFPPRLHNCPLLLKGMTPLSGPITLFLSYIGAILIILATFLTFLSWYHMGNSWRIGIDPNEKTELVTTGPFRHIRHPIYSLSITLAIASFLTLMTPLMLITVYLHVILFNLEAHREEQQMIKTHGKEYLDYMKHTVRLFPKFKLAINNEK